MTLTGRMVVLVRVDVRGHELPFAAREAVPVCYNITLLAVQGQPPALSAIRSSFRPSDPGLDPGAEPESSKHWTARTIGQ